MLKPKNWHYLNYKGDLYLLVQQKTNTFLEVYGRFWQFHMLQLGIERCDSRCVLTVISVKILHKYDETSLTVTSIAVSLTLK